MLYLFKEEISRTAVGSEQMDKGNRDADVLKLVAGWATVFVKNQLVALSSWLERWAPRSAKDRCGCREVVSLGDERSYGVVPGFK